MYCWRHLSKLTNLHFFSWLGTIPYLTQDAVYDTLRDISELAAAGSEIVFDYADTSIDPKDEHTVRTLKRFAERRGEPLITQMDARSFCQEMVKLGFEVIENISQANWRLQYYGSSDTSDLRPISTAHIAHLRVS